MKKLTFLLACIACLFLASCNSYRLSMREPNVVLKLTTDDMELTEQVSSEHTVVCVLGINWAKMFKSTKNGTTSVIGGIVPTGANDALYDLMNRYKGYDVVVYPQVEIERHAPIFGTDLYSKTHYKVTARMGKLKK